MSRCAKRPYHRGRHVVSVGIGRSPTGDSDQGGTDLLSRGVLLRHAAAPSARPPPQWLIEHRAEQDDLCPRSQIEIVQSLTDGESIQPRKANVEHRHGGPAAKDQRQRGNAVIGDAIAVELGMGSDRPHQATSVALVRVGDEDRRGQVCTQ